MGCAQSVPEPPHQNYDLTGLKAVLTEKGSPTACVFENAAKFSAGGLRALELTCSSPPGMALVQQRPNPRGPYKIGGAAWSVFDCAISSTATSGARCTFDGGGFLQRPHDNRVLNVSEWKYEPGVAIEFIRDCYDETGRGKTRTAHGKQGGRGWVFHEDGTLSPIEAPHLVIGWEQPDATLVTVGSPDACVFEHAKRLVDEKQGGSAQPLTLSSHPGLAIVPRTCPRRIDKWKVAYQHLGLADAAQAIPMVLEDGSFLVSKHTSSSGFVLDVPFDKRTPGCNGIPLGVICFDHGARGKNKERGNKARQWKVNTDGTISPSHSPNLVIGVKPGTRRPPTTGASYLVDE